MNFIEALSEAMKANREATMICPSCQRPFDKNSTDRPGPECGCEQASLPMTARIDPVEVAGRVGTPGTVLILRTCDSKLQSYGGFQWPESGVVVASDWTPSAQCGNGLHGLLWGEGDGGLLRWTPEARWLVIEVPEGSTIDLAGKVKFPRGVVVFCGERIDAIAYMKAHGAVGRCIVGDTVAAGDRGTATADYHGTATAGDLGTATAGEGGVIVVAWWDAKREVYRRAVAEVGENLDANGVLIQPDTKYWVNETGQFVRVDP